MNSKSFGLILFIALVIPILSLKGEILIEDRKDGEDWILTIFNKSESPYNAMIISSDQSYRSEKGQITIPPGENSQIRIIREGDGHEEQLYLRLISDHSENPGIYSPGKKSEPVETPDMTYVQSDLEYYYSKDCGSCRDFLAKTIPELEEKTGKPIRLETYDVTTTEGLNKLMESLSRLGSNETKLPLIIIEETILAGDKEIEKELEETLLGRRGKNRSSGQSDGMVHLSLLPVFTAGLLDGINPCAFSTLIFLLSWLGLAGRSRKEILVTGIFFSLSVFITYYAVGLGGFTALRSGSSFQWISWFLKYAMAAVLLILAVLHLRDYRKIRKGQISDITLQLSRERKRKIHHLVRENTRKAGLITGSLFLGFTVTIFELGCTGQIYLPTLMYMTRMDGDFSSYVLLAFYNLAFILPLLVVFFLAWKGMTSQKLARWFSRKAGLVKLLSALFFIVMAGLLIFLL